MTNPTETHADMELFFAEKGFSQKAEEQYQRFGVRVPGRSLAKAHEGFFVLALHHPRTPLA